MAFFFWSQSDFSKVLFPQSVPEKTRQWPQEVLRWTNSPVHLTLVELGCLQRFFFSSPEALSETFKTTLKNDTWTQNPAFLEFFWSLYDTLWQPLESSEWCDRADVTPAEVIDALTTEYKKWID